VPDRSNRLSNEDGRDAQNKRDQRGEQVHFSNMVRPVGSSSAERRLLFRGIASMDRSVGQGAGGVKFVGTLQQSGGGHARPVVGG
ncbi:MAG TPA: hypothetical protein VNF71_14525, partial [Acidimicrobiales bacterium]|nr:hypothetical protein [Acidimicrobiales bacterium]